MEGLQSSSNSALFALGKAASLARAYIAAFTAHNIALASAPAPFNFALAAAVDTASAMSIAKIIGVKGFAKGGLVTGGVGGRDSVPAMLTPGEVVVPANNFDQLINAFGGTAGGGQQVEVKLTLNDNLIDFVEAEINQRQAIGVS